GLVEKVLSRRGAAVVARDVASRIEPSQVAVSIGRGLGCSWKISNRRETAVTQPIEMPLTICGTQVSPQDLPVVVDSPSLGRTRAGKVNRSEGCTAQQEPVTGAKVVIGSILGVVPDDVAVVVDSVRTGATRVREIKGEVVAVLEQIAVRMFVWIGEAVISHEAPAPVARVGTGPDRS